MSQDASALKGLKERLGALILAHSYQPPEIQDIADEVGDSLELSRFAMKARAPLVVFCGVRFMAETAKILSPDSVVRLVSPGADCSLAACMSGRDAREWKTMHPGAVLVTYVNSSVAVKAESWACCTSANAVSVVRAAPAGEVLFGPDRNLAAFAAQESGRNVIPWPGGCHAHAGADIRDLRRAKEHWPEACVLVHPETPPVFWREADHVLGTGGMIRFVSESKSGRFIIGTEEGMLYRLSTLFPDREFMAAGGISCADMRNATIDMVFQALDSRDAGITVPEQYAEPARRALERMTAL
ncbi:MAG: quinolinate synthase NadA [Candidatus Fermentibacteraceae bacterium]